MVDKQNEANPQDIKLARNRKEECQLTVSDWVTFLASEKHGTSSSIFSAGSLMLALAGIFVASKTTDILQTLSMGLFIFAFIFYFFQVGVKPFEKRNKIAESLLERIMLGKLNGEQEIREAWAREIKSRRRRI